MTTTRRRHHDVTYIRQPFNPWIGYGFLAIGFVLGAIAVFVGIAAGLAMLV